MSYILNLETATKNCSVALANDGKTIALAEYAGEGYLHAEKLHVFINEVLAKAGITYKDLEAVAVSMGPGSYTGLRIGVSAAKGLCYTLDIPLIAVDTLELLAQKVKTDSGTIIPLIDARRMEVYSAVFSIGYAKVRETQAEIITPELFAGIEGTIHFAGDGAAKCKEIITGSRFVYHDEVIYPSANEMSTVSYDKYKKSDIVDVAYFEPYYLKDFVISR